MKDFNQAARTWDANPMHTERSEAIARCLLKNIPVNGSMKAMDFGAGTGILGLMLSENFGQMHLLDTSTEMVAIMQEKVQTQGKTDVFPVCHDLVREPYFPGTFDVLFSQLVLHHIDNIPDLLKRFHEQLRPGGYLALADIYTEDGSFHGEGFTGHLGFDPAELADQLRLLGFVEMRFETCYTIRKNTASSIREFPVFLLTGKKPIENQKASGR